MPDFNFIEDADLREKVENAHKLEVDELTVNLNSTNKTAVEEAVKGLKTKNTELLGEKKTLQEQFKPFETMDVVVVKDALEFHEKNKDVEFLKDGTVEELIDKKTSQLRSDHETVVTELSGKLKSAETHGKNYQTLFESKVIDDGLTKEALAQGVRAEALQDVVLRGRSVFSLDEAQLIEARDKEGKLAVTEDKKVLTPKNWIKGLKETSPHYWPGSTGAGADSGVGGSDSDYTAKMADLAAKGDTKGYRELRAKHQASKK